jgi:hypothetical protein
MLLMRNGIRATALAAVALLAADAAGDAASHDVASVFHVAKSENRNEVHYGMHLDDRCAPAGDAPIFAYWRMFERGPRETEPLLAREFPAYGVQEQRVLERTATGGRTSIKLRALSGKAIVVESFSRGDACTATASTSIAGAQAVLERVYATVRWPFGVSSIVVSGRAVDGGRELRETLHP